MHAERRTKIVATIGPATESGGVIRELIEAGVNVFRLNFSHGTHPIHALRIETIRQAAAEMGKHVAIMQDIQGPKIRVGDIKEGTVLKNGQTFVLSPREIKGDEKTAHVSYERLALDVPVGAAVLLDDGKLELKVTGIQGEDLLTEVVTGGPLSSHKGVNFPGCPLKISILTEKDKEDLLFGLEKGVDLVAASFVRYPSDILEIKDVLGEMGRQVPIIAKIEQQEAVKHLVDILAVSDGVIVARGDLGVEMLFEELPLIQKRIIKEANFAGKPVITATQMLDSMVASPRPTRAEVSDVANAILDGTDAVMLSNETAVGAFPVLAVKTMARIALETEKSFPIRVERPEMERPYVRPIQDAIGHAATHMAPELGAAAIITPTSSGSSARMVAKYRPRIPVIAVATSPEVCRRLSLVWGVYPLLIEGAGNLEQLTQASVQAAMEAGFVADGDLVIVVSGIPVGTPGSTNLIKVEIVASVLGRGLGLGRRPASGIARLFLDPKKANETIQKGDILLAPTTDAAWVPAMQKAAGIVVSSSGLSSQTALVGLELGIPVILGVDEIGKIPDGQVVTLDPSRGLVFRGLVKI
ncbi:MAG TPA: pyruvate kinase [Chroococcales cyanobacterium]